MYYFQEGIWQTNCLLKGKANILLFFKLKQSEDELFWQIAMFLMVLREKKGIQIEARACQSSKAIQYENLKLE